MLPVPAKTCFVQGAQIGLGIGLIQQARPWREKQPNGVLHRLYRINQVMLGDEVQPIQEIWNITPWTDIPDFLDGLDFIAEHDLIYAVEPVQYAIRLLLPPGSSLLDKSYTQPYLGALDEAGFSWNWQHPDPRVDALQKQVAALVEQSAQVGEDQLVTFYKIRELALSALAGRKLVSVGGVQGPVRSERPPRLTEAWFC